jgi:hypothetical protein
MTGGITSYVGRGYETVEPLARRVSSDRKLRRHASEALGSAQRLHALLRDDDRRQWPMRLAADADVQAEVRSLVTELRAAAKRLQRPSRRRRIAEWALLAGGAFVVYRIVRGLREPAPAE